MPLGFDRSSSATAKALPNAGDMASCGGAVTGPLQVQGREGVSVEKTRWESPGEKGGFWEGERCVLKSEYREAPLSGGR